MPALTIPRNATILVCDAKKALFFTNHGDSDLPDIRLAETVEAEANPATAEQGTDRPGRFADGASGSHRSAVEQTDWHDRAESAFAGEVAQLLAARNRSAPEQLIVVAPPRMLGDLRKKLSSQVAATVIAEIDKDLVSQPVDQIERSLVGMTR